MSKIKSARTLREPAELVARGLVPAVDLPDLEKVAARYAVAVTADIAALIDPRDPDDPIARQFVPSAAELVTITNVASEASATARGESAHFIPLSMSGCAFDRVRL